MDDFKQCKQCGKMLPTSMFRKYYGGRKGSYKYCLTCEKINNREKYLMKKATFTAEETEELDMIHKLWQIQRMNGLQPPHDNRNKASVADKVEDLLADYEATQVASSKSTDPRAAAHEFDYTEIMAGDNTIPAELSKWLTVELTEEPDYYQDTIYEQLKDKYRPVIEINQDTLMPVYDDTYKQVLNLILERFDDYEDNYDWDKED